MKKIAGWLVHSNWASRRQSFHIYRWAKAGQPVYEGSPGASVGVKSGVCGLMLPGHWGTGPLGIQLWLSTPGCPPHPYHAPGSPPHDRPCSRSQKTVKIQQAELESVLSALLLQCPILTKHNIILTVKRKCLQTPGLYCSASTEGWIQSQEAIHW